MALLSLDRHDVLETIRQSNGLHEAFLRVAKLPAVGEYKTLTNADRIRAMGDTELAEFLWDVWRHKDPFYKECVDGWLVPFFRWLKQEASDAN